MPIGVFPPEFDAMVTPKECHLSPRKTSAPTTRVTGGHGVSFRPIQVMVQKPKRALTVDGVWTVEKLEFSPVANLQLVVVAASTINGRGDINVANSA